MSSSSDVIVIGAGLAGLSCARRLQKQGLNCLLSNYYGPPQAGAPALTPAQRPVQVGTSLFVCGDHRDNGSINGAIQSGHRTADAVIARMKDEQP